MPHPADIQAKLAADLPRYCVPHDIVVVPALPTTMSGKIDEAALLGLLAESGTDGTGHVDLALLSLPITPRTPTHVKA